MFNSFQSAYTKFHSTETTLLALHDDLINAMDKQQVTCITLLELSAAFDTIYHSIFLNAYPRGLAFVVRFFLGFLLIFRIELFLFFVLALNLPQPAF